MLLKLVDKILLAKRAGHAADQPSRRTMACQAPSALERDRRQGGTGIDQHVYRLHDLTPEEIRIVEDGGEMSARYCCALDDVMCDVLGLPAGEREAVYEAVIDLVRARLEKAKSV